MNRNLGRPAAAAFLTEHLAATNALRTVVGISMLALQVNVFAMGCGDLNNAYGPFDYANPEHRGKTLELVTSNHFTPEVENLTSGKSGYIGGDLDYTLRAFPNHHQALDAMGRLGIKEKTTQPQGARYTIECYFDRAIRFKPDDAVVRLAYGVYLNRIGKADAALEQFKEADRLAPDNANVNYNLGLLYFAKKDYPSATRYAEKAYSLGFPLPGLKQKLIAVGYADVSSKKTTPIPADNSSAAAGGSSRQFPVRSAP